MKTFVVSDLHFGHTNMIKYENRPFQDVEEMDASLIEQWNKTVAETDIVYILGDFTLRNVEYAADIIKKLNGIKTLVLGNHDYFATKKAFPTYLFKEIVPYKEISYNGKKIIMCHFPIADWNEKEHGSIHLYGHVHTVDNSAHRFMKEQLKEGYKCYNVGWDVEHRLFDMEEFTNEPKSNG